MATVTTTTAAVALDEKWAAKVLMATESNLVLANLVDRYDADVSQSGDVVHIVNIADLGNATAITQGSEVSFVANTEAENTITVDQWAGLGVEIPDIVKAQSHTDLMGKYTDKIGYSIAKTVDSSLAGLATGFSQNVAAGTAWTVAEVLSAIELLDLADAPQSDRAFVVSPRAMTQLRSLAEFTLYDRTGEKGLPVGGSNGYVGNVFNVPVFQSTNVDETAGTPNTVNNMMFHKEAMGLAMQKAPNIESDRNVRKQQHDIVGSVLYGFSELRDSFGVSVDFDYT